MRAQLTLARLPPGPHLFWLCLFAFLGMLISSTIRVATDQGTGIVTGAPPRPSTAAPPFYVQAEGSRRILT